MHVRDLFTQWEVPTVDKALELRYKNIPVFLKMSKATFWKFMSYKQKNRKSQAFLVAPFVAMP